MKHINPQVRDRLITGYNNGYRAVEMADAFGITLSEVGDVIQWGRITGITDDEKHRQNRQENMPYLTDG